MVSLVNKLIIHAQVFIRMATSINLTQLLDSNLFSIATMLFFFYRKPSQGNIHNQNMGTRRQISIRCCLNRFSQPRLILCTFFFFKIWEREKKRFSKFKLEIGSLRKLRGKIMDIKREKMRTNWGFKSLDFTVALNVCIEFVCVMRRCRWAVLLNTNQMGH